MKIIKNNVKQKKEVIFLDGPQGNAYFLLGTAMNTCRKSEWEKINAEMMGGDYVNLVKTFEKYFGNYYELCASEEYAKSQGLIP
jgi:hypothetical protein